MQQGIALLQVLLISAVLSLLGLFITKTARQQVAISTSFDARAQAVVENYDAEATLLFGLLTESKSPTRPFSQDLSIVTEHWNFYGKPFQYKENTIVTLQDIRGLLSISYPSEQRWMRVLTKQGLNDYDAQRLLSRIKDWQDVDLVSRYMQPELNNKNGIIQAWSELAHLGIPNSIREYLALNATFYRGATFNPMTAPDSLISKLYDAPLVEQIIKMRNSRELTPDLFSSYTGVQESMSLLLYPSNNYKITLESEVGGARVRRTLYYLLEPSSSKPVNLVASEG
ncbi:type II secretion system protein GspK [Pseudoalteromonas sp. S16_S37]|uniref:type II secretion system protein GspK n=1 Tax=Pseudoalteromonas sp. S16_S37 TaxID=2720228 RepID=UPI0016818CCA|nr:type II secretion system protein GspK [Pseudoalteromonas sp. S16_S37]MBD1580975.1 general secretion pathway protein GspK [Pseudoalteromonas sp. S16_S37]